MTTRGKATVPRPRQPRGAPVVERVLDRTLEELARVGFHRVSVPEIAELAGVNKTSVYRRWATKEALVASALERAMGHDAPLPDTGSLRSDMRAFALAAAAWVSSPIGLGVTKTLLSSGGDPDIHTLVARLMRTRTRGPQALFARAIARGELDAEADTRMAMTVIAGAMSHQLIVEHGALTSAFVRRLVDLVVDGLAGSKEHCAP
jgi:AcrR family transcriptional regulator